MDERTRDAYAKAFETVLRESTQTAKSRMDLILAEARVLVAIRQAAGQSAQRQQAHEGR